MKRVRAVPLVPFLATVLLFCPGSRYAFAQVAPPGSPAFPQEAGVPPDTIGTVDQAAIESSLEQARLCIKTGEYDRATEILKTAIDRARGHLPRLREAYLLLIQTYIYRGNYYRSQPEGRETSELYYQQARKVIQECLETKELRHTVPDPPSEYPPEMITLFDHVRSQIFGALRVIDLDPPDAVVIMDGDTLRALPNEAVLGDVDIPIGPHLVVARRDGYKDYTEEIAISPNSTLERSLSLSKKRGTVWYASRAGIVTAGVVGVVLVTRPNDENPTPAEPLPGPPPPPE
jgi:hypothetical protein